MKDGSIMVIGIAGGTGSGKTTITRKIMQRFGGNVSVIYPTTTIRLTTA